MALFSLIYISPIARSVGGGGGKLRESGCLQTYVLKAPGVFQWMNWDSHQSGMDYIAFIQAGGYSGYDSGVPNRYMVDGSLRQQKIKDIIKTWTGPKMSL